MTLREQRALNRRDKITITKIPLHSLNHHSFHFELDCKKSWDLLYSMSIKKWENENKMVAPLFVDKNIIRKISLRDR
ncbi:hypothetical protein CRU94_07460 [Arcobacter sp. AHV-9/2010]|jgi:hypothetical protein|uniref:Uncharacterized protein n=1 Tax=Aliarcobacter skirrowii TaxID=28200 RepID=A0A2U2BZV5_9BACT|nr:MULTISPECIES: hypothetical protein [Arcobacteraceae]MDD2508584.1 hypothetical protein [Aliarcobacter skirrowii]MDD3497211.1 hypothetical protein [Aliarcobacter skirrowii]MDX4061546.1 hypothetical protein [Aliarcobacter skirrowii]PWE20955.1 hypothetical protein DF188_07185 [Aliarcobacter skirrowii]RXJ94965.1 hypothetical protein CRU94_07460 [Arcobacter sp. CECT 9299]